MLGIRQKLSLGFGGLLIIILIIGTQSIIQLTRLGESIDVILRENYRSVIACQEMKEALERMDSGILFTLLGYPQEGADLIRKNEEVFEKALLVELNNITVPGEGEKARQVQELFEKYRKVLRAAEAPKTPAPDRQQIYITQLFPLFQEIKTTASQILDMNQQNMSEANDQARNRAASSRRYMYILLLAGCAVSAGFVIFTEKWILRPIHRLIRSAEEIKSGNLDLVVPVESKDEVGRLSESFNAMAEGLRAIRRSDQARLVRIQDSTQHTFNSLPDAVAVLDLQGRVEVATESAKTVFGLKPGIQVQSLPLKWLADLYDHVLQHARPMGPEQNGNAIQHFDKGQERFFRPMVVPILDAEKQPAGVVMTLKDVTEQRHQDDLKRGVISTVSHQLKTPLTSMRMAIHLLLEEKVGPLTEKQAELLVAAREDSDRLHDILNNLLDISRIESGRIQMEFRSGSPREMAVAAVESFRTAAKDQGVALELELPDDLPEVWADKTRVSHVFTNLLSNALKHTPPGGKVTVSARGEESGVAFSIADTGKGIPSEYLPRIFEQFFRVPDQGTQTGAGLGLAIVKEIVEAHGGTVSADSIEGKGSTFSFTLRRVDPVSNKEISS
jgi:signal transduction histidine kinase/HAMP domain-containing protein